MGRRIVFPWLLVVLAAAFVVPVMSSHGQVFASNSTTLRYAALGDSITNAGYLSEPERYPNLYGASMGTALGVPVTVTNLGVPGYFSNSVLNRLQNDETYKTSVREANVITLMIGINDFSYGRAAYLAGICGGSDGQDCLRGLTAGYRANLGGIITQLKALQLNGGTQIVLTDLYDPYVAADTTAGDQAVVGLYFAEMNAAIHDIAAANGLHVADLYHAFNGSDGLGDTATTGYMADVVHPNAPGDAAIAAQLSAQNNSLLTADSDGDSYANDKERRLGTDLLASCSVNLSHAAFPPDFNHNGIVDMGDLMMSFLAFGRSFASLDWATRSRFDLSEDRKITMADVLVVVRTFGRSYC